MSSALPAPGSAVKWPPNELRLILIGPDNPQLLERHIQQILIHLDLRNRRPCGFIGIPANSAARAPGPNETTT